MNKKNKQAKTSSIITGLLILVASVVYSMSGDMPELFYMFAVIAGIGVMLSLTRVLTSKKKNSKADTPDEPEIELHRPFPQPKKAPARSRPLFQHADEQNAEEAVYCHHSWGKEKYIEQLDSYLKAGLIDRAEYKVMKERYSKLEIPDDYH